MSEDVRSCTACKRVKPSSEFPFSKQSGKPEAKCFPCRNAHQRQYWARRAAMKVPSPRRSSLDHLPALERCIASGMTAQEAARQLSLSISRVYELAKDNGLPPFARAVRVVERKAPVWDGARLARLARLARAGLSAAQIASRIPGATRNSVIGAMDRNRTRLAELAR